MKSLFRQQVLDEQQSRLQGEVSLTRPPTFSLLAGLISFIVLISLVFLITGSYKRKEVVFGILQPEQGIIRVQSSQSGTVTQFLIAEGDKVEAGQALLQLTMNHYSAEQTELNATLRRELSAILANLQQQKLQETQKHQLRLQEAATRITNLKKQQEQLQNQYETFQQRLELNRHLVNQVSQLSGTGFISNIELSRQQDTLLSLQQQEQTLVNQQLVLEEQLQQQLSAQQQLPLDFYATQGQLDNQISELRNQLTRQQHEQSVLITAPLAGTVTGILLKPGQYLTSGSVALSILPDNTLLEAIVYVPTRAIAFIESGQNARIRFHAFPYERFGVHEGQVLEISHTVIMPSEVPELVLEEPAYRIRIGLQQQFIYAYNRELPLRAGMALDADIITEQRSLIRWLFDPIFSLKGRL
ncbi:HlyD family efflux transporter periplasmic adaptor subunit [Chromatiaceae bacterium AAb-1]|nr:HlyD family efflux transporter periplasmic adaptor subunit [Chromatiaceae bacterium AAb-1]